MLAAGRSRAGPGGVGGLGGEGQPALTLATLHSACMTTHTLTTAVHTHMYICTRVVSNLLPSNNYDNGERAFVTTYMVTLFTTFQKTPSSQNDLPRKRKYKTPLGFFNTLYIYSSIKNKGDTTQ